MVGGHDNTYTIDGVYYDKTAVYTRARQFYLSPDIDLTRIPVHKKGLRTALIMLNCLKFPMPALEYHTNEGMKAHWIHY